MGSISDEALAGEAKTCRRAFGVLYQRHQPAILAYLRRRTRCPDLAADLTGEVFARALAGLGRRRDVAGPFSAWLFGIARLVLMESYRRARLDALLHERLVAGSIALGDEALDRIDRLGEADVVRGALSDLPAPQREAIIGRFVHGHSYDDIARGSECSPQVVRKRVSRGATTLRRTLELEIA
jgi:RNA polymerase sigma factor (sigma-70 family)